MAVLKWLLAGTLGAGIGGVIWVLLGYFADVEVGYVAWGIGLLAGLGVRCKMDAREINPAAGIAAVAAALLVIAGAKYVVVRLHVDSLLGPFLAAQENVDPVEFVADDIVTEREAAGQTIEWPESEVGPQAGGGVAVSGYPAEILAEAQERWKAMPEPQRAEYEAAKRVARAEQLTVVREAINNDAFKASFGPYDLLWFGLAIFTAFKVGRGMASQEQPTPTTEPAELDEPKLAEEPPPAQV